MSEGNENLTAALEKLQIPIENYQTHANFGSLPATRDDSLWNVYWYPPHELNYLQMESLKNARCRQPSEAGKD